MVRRGVLAMAVMVTMLAGCGGSSTGPSVTQVDDSWFFGGEDVWIPVIDPLARNLGAASRAYADHDAAAAAVSLRQAAAFLEGEVERAAPDKRPKLRDTAATLKVLADTVESGAAMTRESFAAELREAYAADVDCRWSAVPMTEWMPVVEQLQGHLEAARERLAAVKPQDAATEMRKAAALLRLEAGRIGGADQKLIEGAWFEVRQIASRAQQGTLDDPGKLDHVAARAHQTLAQAHLDAAVQLWQDHRPGPSGQVLGLAVRELESGLVWAGAQTDETVHGAAEEARRLAEALVAGGALSEEEVVAVHTRFAAAVGALRERLQPAPAG